MKCPKDSIEFIKKPEFKNLHNRDFFRHIPKGIVRFALVDYANTRTGKYDYDYIPESDAEIEDFIQFYKSTYQQLSYMSRGNNGKTLSDVVNEYEDRKRIGNWTPVKLAERIDDLTAIATTLLKNSPKGKIDSDASMAELLQGYVSDSGKVGIDGLLNDIFLTCQKEAIRLTKPGEYEKIKNADYRISQYNKIVAFKDQLGKLLMRKLAEKWGFKYNENNLSSKISIVEAIDYNDAEAADDNDDRDISTSENEDRIAREEAAKGDRYNDIRLDKCWDTLTPKVKGWLSERILMDLDRRKPTTDIGNVRFLDPRMIMQKLRRALANSTPQSMMEDIDYAARSGFPDLISVFDGLVEEPDMADLLFPAIKATEKVYTYGTYVKGKGYVEKRANSKSQGYYVSEEAMANVKSGSVVNEKWSIYTSDRMSLTTEQYSEMHSRLREFVKKMNSYNLDKIQMIGTQDEDTLQSIFGTKKRRTAMEQFFIDHAKEMLELTNMVQGLGYVVTVNDIKYLAVQTMTKKQAQKAGLKGNNKLYSLMAQLDSIYKCLDGGGNKHEAAYPSQEIIFGTGSGVNVAGITHEYNAMQRLLALAKFEEVEGRSYNNGKSLNAYTHTSLIHQVMGLLGNRSSKSHAEHLNELYNNYLRFEGMALGSLDDLKVSGWLKFLVKKDLESMAQKDVPDWAKKLYHNLALNDKTPSMDGKTFILTEETTFNGVEYPNLSTAQKINSSLAHFFSHTSAGVVKDRAMYEVPIQGDYGTAYNFVTAPVLKTGNFVKKIKSDYDAIGSEEIYVKEIGRNSDKQPVYQLMATENKTGWPRELKFILKDKTGARSDKVYKFVQVPEGYNEPLKKGEISSNAGEIKGATFTLSEEGDIFVDDNTYIEELINSNLVNELFEEVMIELERISSAEERLYRDRNHEKHSDLGQYEENATKFALFPSFNDSGIRDRYISLMNDGDVENAERVIKEAIAIELINVRDKDIAMLEENGIFGGKGKHALLKDIGLYSPTGKYEDLFAGSKQKLDNALYNIYYARYQMTKLFTGGFTQFAGLADYEKRNMMLHAPHSELYTAKWSENGGHMLGNEPCQNCLYFKDDEVVSAYYNEIQNRIEGLHNDGLIPNEVVEDAAFNYSHIKPTDGIAFRTLPSFRLVMKASGKWNKKKEAVYKKINKGEVPTPEEWKIFFEDYKPVFAGYEIIEAAEGENQKPIKLTVLHKYSETVLLPPSAFGLSAMSESPMYQVFNGINSHLSANDKADVFLFKSDVKVGCFNAFQTFSGKDKTTGKRLLTSVEDMIDYTVAEIKRLPHSIHRLEMKYYGEAASMTPHDIDSEISRSAQAENAKWQNVLPGEIMNLNGTDIPTLEGKGMYYDLKLANEIAGSEELREIFSDKNKLEELLDEEIASKPYSSEELEFAFKLLKNGQFAIPIFASGASHSAEAIFQALIKKRMIRQQTSGVNIKVTTSYGNDVMSDPFDDKRDQKKLLGVHFPDAEDNKFYFDVSVPLPDFLHKYAVNGRITYDQLWGENGLVKRGIIPAEYLYMDASRTPADAEHSCLPVRVKYFTAKWETSSMAISPEAMVMTGQDLDGDKMRLNIRKIKEVINEDLLFNDFCDDMVKAGFSLGIVTMTKDDPHYKKWREQKLKEVTGDSNYIKYEVVKYDWSKSPMQNSADARHNAMMDLDQAMQSSESGINRILIPGGCEIDKKHAYSISIVRQFKVEKSTTEEGIAEAKRASKDKMRAVLDALKDKFGASVSDTSDYGIYKALMKCDSKFLRNLLESLNGNEAPYSLHHSADAYNYIVGGKEMISPFALYGGATNKMQRCNFRYVPKKTKYGENKIYLFGNEITDLFQVKNFRGNYSSLVNAGTINAAVDNNKEPFINYLNLTKEFTEIINFFIGAGLSKEQIYLIMTQPIMFELSKRMKEKYSGNLTSEIYKLMTELADAHNIVLFKNPGEANPPGYIGTFTSILTEVGKYNEEHYVNSLRYDYEDLKSSENVIQAQEAIRLLEVLKELVTPANYIAKFVKVNRQDAASGATGATLANSTKKEYERRKFVTEVMNDYFSEGKEGSQTGIAGFAEALGFVKDGEVVFDGDKEAKVITEGTAEEQYEYFKNKPLSEIYALVKLMTERVFDYMKVYFPQAERDWRDVATEIADYYSDRDMSERRLTSIAKEMIMFKMLGDKRFTSDDPSTQEYDIICNLPKRLQEFMDQVKAAEVGTNKELKYRILRGNKFLHRLSIEEPSGNETRPYIMFNGNGPSMEGLRQEITNGWALMMMTGDPEISKLATDLYLYCMYTNALNYGMYSFAHYAPFNVIVKTPGYRKVSCDMVNAGWDPKANRHDVEMFKDQYVLNHAGDKGLLSTVKLDTLESVIKASNKTPDPYGFVLRFFEDNKLKTVRGFINVTDSKNDKYTVQIVSEDGNLTIKRTPRLYDRMNNGTLVTLHYQPYIDDIFDAHQVVIGDDSVWGDMSLDDPYAENETNEAAVMPEELEEMRRSYMESFLSKTVDADEHERNKIVANALKLVKKNLKPVSSVPVEDPDVETDTHPDMEDISEQKKLAENAEIADRKNGIPALTLDDFIDTYEYDETITTRTSETEKAPKVYDGNIEPDDDTIFVFGSNPEGRHGAGAAKVAHDKFGAEYGVGEGLTGNAYALPTKDLRVRENNGLRSISADSIINSIKELYKTAINNPKKKFKIAYRNTTTASLNGYTGIEMMRMFKAAGAIPSNIYISREWANIGILGNPEGKSISSSGNTATYSWARTSDNNYEVSSDGDSRFSALRATFSEGTSIFGHDVSGRTIESVYQHGVKQGDWKTDSNTKTGAPKDKTIIKGNTEDDSFAQGYLPLWIEWANQNTDLIEDLRQKAEGKVLTDKFASSRVSQARALAYILNKNATTNTTTGGTIAGINSGDSSDEIIIDRSKIISSNADLQKLLKGSLSLAKSKQNFAIAGVDKNGNPIIDDVPATRASIFMARKQRAYVKLHKSLTDILDQLGFSVGVLTKAEARMGLAGITDFDTARVTAEGIIRLAEGEKGMKALPEEFAHLSIALLGRKNVLVNRLLNALETNTDAMKEAFGNTYDWYNNKYENNIEIMCEEAAGKLVAKHLFRQMEIKTSSIKRLVYRVCDFIKDLWSKISKDEVRKAINEADKAAGLLAKELLGGRLLDDKSVDDIRRSGQLFSQTETIINDLTDKNDILNKILKTEVKKLGILIARNHGKNTNQQIEDTKVEITRLKKYIENETIEEGITAYMKDSMQFLINLQRTVDEYIDRGATPNKVCKALTRMHDILCSYSTTLDAVNEAISHGEVIDTVDLQASISEFTVAVNRLNIYYKKIADEHYLESLAGVYGKEGVYIDVGKKKGTRLSIKDIAYSGNDISFFNRLFHAAANTGDFVLMAIDDITSNAKIRARQKAAAIKLRIDKAFDDYYNATGSRDQSFMFEFKDGVKTGKYIMATTAATTLNDAQFKFYMEMMSIKNDLDKLLPTNVIEDRKIVMLRKDFLEKIKNAHSQGGLKKALSEEIEHRLLDDSEKANFEEYEVNVDFDNKRVDKLPILYTAKKSTESYDIMTEDVATSIMAYAGMAYEYYEMNNVIGILENMRAMSAMRNITQKSGNKNMTENIEVGKDAFRKPFTRKQAQTNIQIAIDDYFNMHVYGHIKKDEGTFGNTRISKQKVVNALNGLASYCQMAFNIPQRISNVSAGGVSVLVEAIGGNKFSMKEIMWANGVYMHETADRLAAVGKLHTDNKLSLFIDKFDIDQDNGRANRSRKYGKGRARRVCNSNILFAGLSAGEDYLAATTALAAAKHYKMIYTDENGKKKKESNLWEALDVRYTHPDTKEGAYIVIKNGYKKADGSTFSVADERAFSKEVANLNQSLQGIYNLDDRAPINQIGFGSLIIMYRKWIAPSLKRRYGGTTFNVKSGRFEEGYYKTLFNVLFDDAFKPRNEVSEEESMEFIERFTSEIKAYLHGVSVRYNSLSDYEKSNLKKAFTELTIVVGLFAAMAVMQMLPPDDDDDKEIPWIAQMFLLNALRTKTELASQAPTPALVKEGFKILKSPFAALQPLKDTLNIFNLLLPHNYVTKVKSGRYKGKSQAYKYFKQLPWVSMFSRFENLADPSSQINYYLNGENF